MMSDAEFEARIREIESGIAAHQAERDAYRDRELARLFLDCGWTQERIAGRMGKTQKWVSNRLLFGRFLRFRTGSSNSENHGKPLTEFRFRTHWQSVGKGDRKETEAGRFGRVLESLAAESPKTAPGKLANLMHKPGFKPAVVKVLKEGKRLTTEEIAKRVSETIPGTDRLQVNAAMRQIRNNPPAGMTLDQRSNGRTHKYRLIPRRGPAPVRVDPDRASALAADAIPKLNECIRELQKSQAAVSQSFVLKEIWDVKRALEALLVPEEVA